MIVGLGEAVLQRSREFFKIKMGDMPDRDNIFVKSG
jgi:hypothetical protein